MGAGWRDRKRLTTPNNAAKDAKGEDDQPLSASQIGRGDVQNGHGVRGGGGVSGGDGDAFLVGRVI